MTKRNWMLKTLCGMLFNLAGAYLLFSPQTYVLLFFKIVGVIGLLFSYYIFYVDIKPNNYEEKLLKLEEDLIKEFEKREFVEIYDGDDSFRNFIEKLFSGGGK